MKKIKLILSDLHLGIGKNKYEKHVYLPEEFQFDDKFDEFLNYYTTGEYSNSEVELILNGDIFNLIQVDYRGHHLSVLTESIALDKLRRVVAGHPRFFEALSKFSKNPNNSITYIVGNHDQEMLWPKAREYINETVGTSIRYRNIAYFFDGVHVEHGHMHDITNRIDPKKFFIRKNVPEPILHLPFGTYFFVEFVLKVKMENDSIDKVRPYNAYIRWGLLQDTWYTVKMLCKLVWFLLTSLFNKNLRNPFTFNFLIDMVREGHIFPDLVDSASKILKDEHIHTVIFGHTHVYQNKYIAPEKRYFNTGTWTEVTSLDMASFGKITKLTYVLLEYDENAKIHSKLKSWKGYHRIEEDVDIT